MSALTKSAIEPVTTPRESSPDLLVEVPDLLVEVPDLLVEVPDLLVEVPTEEKPRRATVSLVWMLLACAAFAGSFVYLVLIPAIKTLMGI